MLLAATPASAATPDRCQVERSCREQTEQAAQFAAQTRYDEALARYESAYERVPEPRLLVNIGRCHYRLGRARKALEFYESFQKASIDAEPELLARVGQFIAEAKLAILADASQPADKPEIVAVPPAPVAVPPPLPVETAPVDGAPRAGRPTWRIAVGAGAIGVGAILAGLGAGALGADGKCVTPAEGLPDRCTVMTNADGIPTTRLIDGKPTGIGLLVSGGLLVVGGAVLIALPGRRLKNVSLRRSFDANASGPGFLALRVPAAAIDGGAVR